MCKIKRKILQIMSCAAAAAILVCSVSAAPFGEPEDTSDLSEEQPEAPTERTDYTYETDDTDETEQSGGGTDVSESGTTPTEETEPPPQPQLFLSGYDFYLEEGDVAQLSAWVENYDGDQPNMVYVSSDTSVVRVDSFGYIIAMSEGYAYVTVYAGDLYQYANVYVSAPPRVPEYIVVDEEEITLKTGAAAHIGAKLLPEDAAEGYTLSYSSGNTDVAVVDENGNVTAVSAGEAYITVYGADLSESVHIIVTADVEYDITSLDGYVYNDGGSPVSGARLIIDDLTAVTDSKGYFRFDQVEQRRLTVRSGDDQNASCDITLTGPTTVYLLYSEHAFTRVNSYQELAGLLAVSNVSFISQNLVLTEGESYDLEYRYEPRDASITEINYESSNPLAAQVGQVDGVITARAAGETTITLTLNDGQAVAYCSITVNPKESAEYTPLIILTEALLFAAVSAAAAISYHRYKKKAEKKLADAENEEDLHDIE